MTTTKIPYLSIIRLIDSDHINKGSVPQNRGIIDSRKMAKIKFGQFLEINNVNQRHDFEKRSWPEIFCQAFEQKIIMR